MAPPNPAQAAAGQIDPAAEKPFVFLHIPKTAGTSLLTILGNVFGESNVRRLGPGELHIEAIETLLASPALHEIGCLAGHFSAHAFGDRLSGFRVFTVLRHPVDRVMSLYRFLRRQPGAELARLDLRENFGFDEFLACRAPELAGQIRNGMCDQLCNLPTRRDRTYNGFWEQTPLADIVAGALAALRGMQFGLVEAMPDTLTLLRARLGMPFDLTEAVENASGPPGPEWTAANLLRLVELNTGDLALYHAAAALFRVRVDAQRHRVAGAVDDARATTFARLDDGVIVPIQEIPARQGFHPYEPVRDYPRAGSYVAAVERAISACGHVIVNMADFAAADFPPARVCAERVRSCDVYLGILGTRYGSPVRDRRDVSYTELEFETATEAGLERLVFMLDTDAEYTGIPPGSVVDPEFGGRQEAFRRRVRESGLLTRSFTSPAALGQLVERSLREMGERRRTVDFPVPPEPPEDPRPRPPVPVPPPTNGSGIWGWAGRTWLFLVRRPARAVGGIAAGAALLAALLVLIWDISASSTPHQPGSTGSSSAPRQPGSTRPTPPSTPGTPLVDCASGTLTIDGSDFGSIAQQAATAYSRQCPNAHFHWGYDNGKDSAWGVGQLENAAGDHSKARWMIAMYDGTTTLAKGMTAHPIGMFIYSVIAHTGLYAGSDITLGALKQLFGETGCVAGKLAVGFQGGSATRLELLKLLKNVPSDPNPPGACSAPFGHAAENTYEGALGVVSAKSYAIGYLAVDSVVDGRLKIAGHLTSAPNVSVLTIDGVAPTPQNVHNGSYHFAAVENLYTIPDPAPLAQDFLAFLPRYLAEHQVPDFITCSGAPESMAAQCPPPR